VFYLKTLALPARRAPEPLAIERGESHFLASGCAACHVPEQRTASGLDPALIAGQRFAPYTDLLLHDMGEALADGRPDFQAGASEWRTPPLWGLGLLPAVNGHSFLLHDGRARNLEEAILWHGGEAEAARDRFTEMSRNARRELIAFLESL
jgi:CxxC motif-containing protein (DUF1111 family)